jgi:outer membrane protein
MQSARSRVYLGIATVVGAAAVTLAAHPSPSQGGTTFAYANTQLILQRTPGFSVAESTWNAEVGALRAQLDSLSTQMDSALATFNRTSIGMSPTERQQKQDELRQLNQQYQQRAADVQSRADRRRQELMAPLQDRIQAVIDGIRAERRLSVVFDVGAPGNNIISADPTLDLTNLIVQRLSGGSQ